MNSPWMWLWTAVLVVGIAVFAAMSVWVVVAGWFDIRRLLGRLAEPDLAESDEPQP